jgi:Fe-S oxidoreductase/nitrate reductase gamma subunit
MTPEPTRTVFFTISTPMQVVFYAMALITIVVCFNGFYRRFKLWRQGRKFPPVRNLPKRILGLADQMLAHRRVRRRPYAGLMHLLIFFGMLALFVGTNIVGAEHYGALLLGEHWLYKGGFYLACKIILDIFGMGLLVGATLALGRRYVARPEVVGHSSYDGGFLVLLILATLTGFLLEGAGIAADPSRQAWAAYSPVGSVVYEMLNGRVTQANYALIWWIHVPLVFGVIAALPYGRWLHLFVAPITIVTQPERPMGTLEPESMAVVEETGRIGAGEIGDLSAWQLMSFDGCMECGRCTAACPANAVGKELNPKQIVLDLRSAMANGNKSTDVISDESIWACTNCHACVRECPALIRHVDVIDGIRRFRVAEGRLSGTGATTLRQLASRENPWGLPGAQRLDWAKDLNVTLASEDDGRDVLFWVGCAGAFEPRAQKTIRAIAQLLEMAGVKFSVLGPKERCTGDPARRMGDEFLFQQLAEANVATLNGIRAKTIVTQCPHCFHTLKNEYPQFGGEYEVLHHTQLLSRLVHEGRLKLPKGYADRVAYHDPCWLARVNGITEAPRELLEDALTAPLLEAERRESKTFCCGAGGGRMWMEEDRSQRPGVNRAQELLATGAKTVAVGCPFCKVMVGDSVAQVGGDNPPPVIDVAEIMLAAIEAQKPAAARPETKVT